MNGSIKKIGILTSGGDSPGMNTAIRSITITAIKNNIKVLGIKKGYYGLLNKDIINLDIQTVSDIGDKGGSILHSSRCKEMILEEYVDKAANTCKEIELDTLFVIGGDGSLKAAESISQRDINVICIPGTIDLDVKCSEYTIGFDTAVNTVVDLINKLKDTSFSHERCTIVEVMGRNCGSISLWSGIITGADKILIPEQEDYKNYNNIIDRINESRKIGKKYNIIIASESIKNIDDISKNIENSTGIECRITKLGHIQRGGRPTALDSLHASFMGHEAVKILLEGEKNKIVILKDGKYSSIDIKKGISYKKDITKYLVDLSNILYI